MQKMYFKCLVNYNGKYFDAYQKFDVKKADIEALKSAGGFLVEEGSPILDEKVETREVEVTSEQADDGELKPKPAPKGAKKNG